MNSFFSEKKLSFDFSELEISDFAKLLAKNLQITDVITLEGEIGSGKTHLVRSIIKALSPQEITVNSPTFNLVQCYNVTNIPIWHFDLYRLNSADELEALGLEEALNNAVTIIEWPKIAEIYLRKTPRLHINIAEIPLDQNRRNYSVFADHTWCERLEKSLDKKQMFS